MPTTIHSNGGGLALPIETLFQRLESDPLDRTFEAFGNFVEVDPVNVRGERYLPAGTASFFGNFFTYSHVFHLDTDDADLTARLTAAIRTNQQRPDYLAQETHEQQIARRNAEESARRAKRIEEDQRRARAILGIPSPHDEQSP